MIYPLPGGEGAPFGAFICRNGTSAGLLAWLTITMLPSALAWTTNLNERTGNVYENKGRGVAQAPLPVPKVSSLFHEPRQDCLCYLETEVRTTRFSPLTEVS